MITKANGRKAVRAPNPFDRAVADLARLGLSLFGSRELSVRGRNSGRSHSTPVNPLSHAGGRYLVAPRGQTQWARNLRAAEQGTLRLGRRIEHFTAVEVADDDKPAILRAYLRRWKWEVGAFFEDVGPDSSDAELHQVSARYPVFRLAPANPSNGGCDPAPGG